MKKLITGLLVAGALSSAVATASERTITVDITNLTNAITFTPLLVSAHDRYSHLYQVGTPASANLQAMAEGGDISGLVADLTSVSANFVANPAGGLLGPGASTSATLMMDKGNRHLSIVAMMLPTNDGFIGLDALKIPKKKGSYTYYLNGYDAGTEANDEIINGGGAPGTPGIPADPGGNGGINGAGVTASENNTTVHVHRGIVGDTDPAGGVSDLDSTVHQWINPVVKVVVTVSDKDKDDD